ncbi:class I SAM-dependent methyltransferase [Hymenobacter sp. CRA2]|uniref:class I SAM-dependent methyltransferase n=1 Tax=Hymenobacter sp. CRA2 TaxID=1955620 RepID=UPI00098F337A|nr:class I SAM-dependent methyltransferase [Hymenobacter sp. CRA2]OON65871.1 SAM-dependent methyltransferase [Hymenobacter sp. CRA2]
MNIQQAYDAWAGSYDAMLNKTRDLEARAIRALAPAGPHAAAIELGCGTGKNTEWLAAQVGQLTAVDFSAAMMEQARRKLPQPHIRFQSADITQPWHFAPAAAADLLTCSLVLEHIANLDHVFAEARRVLRPGGWFYLGELHPFRQYQGSRARFEISPGSTVEPPAFVHHLSDFTEAAFRAHFQVRRVQEWFDDDDRNTMPRILACLFQKAD